MKIRLAHNVGTFDGGMEIAPEEIGGKMGIDRVQQLFKAGMDIATDVLKKYPEIKQVTLDTMTDEERNLIEIATSCKNKN